MATNVEKFVVDLGFNDSDLKKLKELLKLQQTANSHSGCSKPTSNSNMRKEKELNAITNKRLQLTKLIARADKEGVDTSRYKGAVNSSQKITNLEKLRLELEELTFKAKEANQKKVQAAKQKELNTEKKIAQEKVKQDSPYMANNPDTIRRRETYAGKVGLRAEKAGADQMSIESFKDQARAAYGSRAAMDELSLAVDKYKYKQRQATMRTRKANIAMQGLNDSTRHMIRSYASLYAVFEATYAINRTGQEFEAMNSAMLAATGTSEMAADEVAFLDKMTSRLGLSLLDTSDAYTKFLFSSKGKLDQNQTRELFTGLSELGTTLGISKERMKLSMNAITQMMNKGKISSEELRLQLAESLPGK